VKKIGLLVLVLVIALGSLGVAYARWSDTVTISGPVTTGKVEICIEYELILDMFPPIDVNGDGIIDYMFPPFDWTVPDGFAGPPTLLDKNVSWGESVVSPDGKLDTVTLHNTYPCNFNNINFYVYNCGTIPVVIWKVQIWKGTDTTGPPDWEIFESQIIQMDFDGGGADIEMKYGNNFGEQMEPGDPSLEISFGVHTLQAAGQGKAYTWTMKLVAVQFNDAP
jgi:predicted ribosomally synthesized peptide with SipW-like signal peptide